MSMASKAARSGVFALLSIAMLVVIADANTAWDLPVSSNSEPVNNPFEGSQIRQFGKQSYTRAKRLEQDATNPNFVEATAKLVAAVLGRRTARRAVSDLIHEALGSNIAYYTKMQSFHQYLVEMVKRLAVAGSSTFSSDRQDSIRQIETDPCADFDNPDFDCISGDGGAGGKRMRNAQTRGSGTRFGDSTLSDFDEFSTKFRSLSRRRNAESNSGRSR